MHVDCEKLYLNKISLIIPVKQRWLIHKQVEIVLGTDFTVPMVYGALKTSGSFAAHL